MIHPRSQLLKPLRPKRPRINVLWQSPPPPQNASATPGEFAKEDGDALRRVVLTQVPQMHRVGLPVIQPVSHPEEEARKGVTNYPDGWWVVYTQ